MIIKLSLFLVLMMATATLTLHSSTLGTRLVAGAIIVLVLVIREVTSKIPMNTAIKAD